MTRPRWVSALAPSLLCLALAFGCGDTSSSRTGPDRSAAAVADAEPSRCGEPTEPAREGRRTVLAISVDGLRPAAVRQLRAESTPSLHQLMRQGASTLNARTAVEDTRTLPNHTSMITGRPVARGRGGHGVDVNVDPGGTVSDRAGEDVSSVFEIAADAGGTPALFASKEKFELFQRSWPCSIDRFVHDESSADLTDKVLRDLAATDRSMRFVHYSDPDVAGHEMGFASLGYFRAVQRVDRQLGRLVRYVESQPMLRSRLVLLLTSDHGGSGRDHDDPSDPADFTIPFIAWGAGVARGADLYALNPERRAPGSSQIGYRGRQPIRNGDLADLTLDVIRLPAVPGSRLNAGQGLDLRRR